ncbi:MAG: type II CAAX endopeptidase family protein [Acidimicrobiia bacterium]
MDESTTATLTRPLEAPAPPTTEPWYQRIWRTYVSDVRRDADARMVMGARADRDAALILVTVAVSLTLSEYWARRDGTGLVASDSQFVQLTAWAIVTIATYVIPAVLLIRFVLRRPLREFGLRFTGVGAHAWIYVMLFAIALPVVVIASYGDAFQAKYPFYEVLPGESFWPGLWVWWGLYWLQFVALEFFFRGFMVHGLAPRLGWVSIFVMAVPYNMLHFGKPMPEALVAIVGAIVLGTLSLKTGSIWLGASLHIAIAITMDLCALLHEGRLF